MFIPFIFFNSNRGDRTDVHVDVINAIAGKIDKMSYVNKRFFLNIAYF
jgi:hypothetical protein